MKFASSWKDAEKVMTQTVEPGTRVNAVLAPNILLTYGHAQQSLPDGSVRVVPAPPQELGPGDVVRGVDQFPKQAR